MTTNILTAMEAYAQTKANRETVSEGLLFKVDSEIRNAVKFGKGEIVYYMASPDEAERLKNKLSKLGYQVEIGECYDQRDTYFPVNLKWEVEEVSE